MIVESIIGLTSGVALGWLLFFSVLSLITFIAAYVYEKKMPWVNKIYLSVFACVCGVLIILFLFTVVSLHKPQSLGQAFNLLLGTEYSRKITLISTILVFFVSFSLFLVGPLEMARRLRPPSRSKQLADISDDTVIETDIPARLDRLPWGNFHWLIAVSLGVTWIFNGIEVSLASTLSPTIKLSMNLEDWQVGYAHAAYVGGLVIGALFFGWLTDRLWKEEVILYHAPHLSVFHSIDRAVSRSTKLSIVPFSDRGGHRRRVRGDQFDNPGTHSG